MHAFKATLGLFGLFVTAAQAQTNPCDHFYVHQRGMIVTVRPTNSDDTQNLRCAIDYAAQLGRSVTVQLEQGTYKTAQLTVQGMKGTIRGVGRERTIIRNSDSPMLVTNPVTWLDSPPSISNAYPTLIAVIGDDVVISDLSIRIVGLNPTTDWYWLNMGPFRFVVPAIALVGSHSALRVRHVEVSGSDKCFPDPGANLLAAIEFWNFVSQTRPWPTASALEVVDSEIRGCWGVLVADVVGADITITRNNFDTHGYGVQAGDLRKSSLDISGNTMKVADPAPAAINISSWAFGTGIQDSSLVLKHNQLLSTAGIWLGDDSFHGSVHCAMMCNNVANATDISYWFRPGTYGCTVIGNGNGTVRDESGGAHKIVTANACGAGRMSADH
jgi:hypothetical protein